MKRKRLLLVLILALAAGGLAGFLALDYLSTQARPLVAAEARKGQVAVATRDLPLGSILRQEDVRLIAWPGEALPPGYASSVSDVVGRGLITPVYMNEPLLAGKLADKEAGGGLPIIIPEGYRGVSVKVDEVIGVAGFVLPGTRVDVLVTLSPGAGREEGMTRVILQNVQTLASGQTIQRDAEGKPQTVTVITLLVTPEDAETLALAAKEGQVQLALRNTLDVAEVATAGVRTRSLVGAPPASRPAAVARSVRPRATVRPATPEGTVVETYRGGVRTLSTFRN